MESVNHGGECCGVSHIFNFDLNGLHRTPEVMAKQLDDEIKAVVEDWESENLEYEDESHQPLKKQPWGKKFGRLFEVCLTDAQMIRWAPILKAKGFRLGQRFKNDNSGNYVTLLTYATKRPNKKAPYTW